MLFERLGHVIRMRVRALLGGDRIDRELDEELQDHLVRTIDANLARGLPPDAARREALLALGGIEQRKEECRDTRRVRLLQDLLIDVKYAVRTLWRAPTFTMAALLTLALGMGASVAVFSVVHGVLLRPLPYPEPDRLFLVAMSPRGPFISEPALADENYLALAEHDRAFAHLATFANYNGNLLGAGDPAVIPMSGVTPDFFAALGVAPAIGRVFLPGEGQEGREPVVVLSDRLWRSRFGADRGALGRQVTIDGRTHVVVGVMPERFEFPARAQAWTPRVVKLVEGQSLMFPVFGRLRAGVTVAEARAQFEALVARLPQRPPPDHASWQVGLIPLKELLVADIRRPLQLFAGAVILVLLIACANVANLLLTRGANREREIAVRAALGAGRTRLIRQLLTESTLLALAGGALAILVAGWFVPAMLALAPAGRIPRTDMIRMDGQVMAFAWAASLITGLVFGIVPALRATAARVPTSSAHRGRAFGAGHERVRGVLVVAEIAVALVLLTGAGLLLRSFLLLRAVDSGFTTTNAVTVNVELPATTYDTVDKVVPFHEGLLDRLRLLPGVVAAGAVNWLPLGTMHMSGDFVIEGQAGAPDFDADKPAVSPGYFRAMDIALIQGRDFDPRDNATGPRVAIVSRTVAGTIAPGGDAVGRRISVESRPGPGDWLTVIGVVADVRQWGPAQSARPAIYRPYLQTPYPMSLRHMSYVVRTTSDPAAVMPAMRTSLRAVDPNQPATSIVPMDDLVARAIAEPGFFARLLGVFAVLAVLLALVGTYGVLSYSVTQRTHEIGVRVALGASVSTIVWLVLRRTLVLSLAGIAIGTAFALLGSRVMTALLFETTPTDPATYVTVAATIFGAALGAGTLPALRAARVDPLVALRHE